MIYSMNYITGYQSGHINIDGIDVKQMQKTVLEKVAILKR